MHKTIALFLDLEAHLDLSDGPCGKVKGQHAGENDEGLAQSRRQRRIVRNDEFSVPELIYEVSGLDGEDCAPDRVKVRLGEAD
jgi:hypothetical protein